MNQANGFISLHRSMLSWDWYDDINTTRLFIHLLLTVNHVDGKWHGLKISRGARITSYQKLSAETGLSVQEVRTALEKLKSTGEITCNSTHHYTLINVVNYNKFQDINFKKGKQQDIQRANKGQQYNKNNKNNNIYYTNYTKEKSKTFKNYTERHDNTLTEDETLNISRLMKKYGGSYDRCKSK